MSVQQIQLHRFNFLIKEFAKTFVDYTKDYERFSKNYNLLFKNLSPDQQEYLNFLFNRMIFTHYSYFYMDNHHTQDERNEMNTLKSSLLPGVQEGNYFRYKDFILPVNHFEISIFYYYLGIEYIKNKEKVAGTDIIDAGAYLGDSAMVLRELNPNKIYAFEPVSDIFNQLIDTINVNNMNEVVEPVKLGLGAQESEHEILIDGSGSTTKFQNTVRDLPKEKIINTTIDNFVEKNNLNVGLIKMDTEGSELEILKGAENTIKTQKPVLLVSIYHNAEEFFEAKPLIDSWDLGYKYTIKKFNPFSFIFETVLICEAE